MTTFAVTEALEARGRLIKVSLQSVQKIVRRGGKMATPWGSKGQVNRAGRAVRDQSEDIEDLITIEKWRAAHRNVLNSFQAILRTRTRNTNIVVAQRHKRRRTIVDKLQRYPAMELSRMDDVAGCRLIFNDIGDLYKFRDNLHRARFKHQLRNEKDKYDYIKHPKDTGYRGVHDIYSYDVNSESGKDYKGLLIELQYRTIYQHAWATAVEVVGHVTENQPKFERGDNRFIKILRLSSEIIARSFENSRSCEWNLTDEELLRSFAELDAEIHFMRMLRGLNAADSEISKDKNVILMFGGNGDDLKIVTFRDATDALQALFAMEKENPNRDIVLVRGERTEDVREAFRNYFSDAKDFINYIDEGCQRLAGARRFEGGVVV